MTRGEVFGLLYVGGRSRVKFIFGGCRGRALREPPKVTPLRGATVRAAACGGPPDERMRIAGLRCGRLRTAQSCGLHFRFGPLFAARRRSLLPYNLINKKRATRARAAFSDGISCSDYSKWGPAATSDLPSSLPVNFEKFLMKRPARSLAFSFHCEASV